MDSHSTFTVLGTGYVGLTTAALLANSGYTVYAVEPNKTRLDVIKQGKSFFYEQGLDPVIQAALAKGTLIPTDSYRESIPKSQIIFSCVGTPDNPDGSSNLNYVFAAAEEAASYLAPDSIYVQKSTVPVGTGSRIETLFKEHGKNIQYVSNPEFLREGTALHDTLFFDRVVVGSRDKAVAARVTEVYRTLEAQAEPIATLAGIDIKTHKGEYITTNLNSAELIKVTANAFLALKISFANSIAKLADTVDADIVEVMNGVGADQRIGRAFLQAGRGYGGGCFPKDVSGLIASGLEHGIDLDIMTAAQAINDSMPGYVIEKLRDRLNGDFEEKRIAVLGLAFKAGTSDVRRSPGIAIANTLKRAGAIVSTYDPQSQKEATVDIINGIDQQETLKAAVHNADAIIIATEWPELLQHPMADYAAMMHGSIIVDAINRLDKIEVEAAGLTYIGVGR